MAEPVGVEGSFFGSYASFLRKVVTGDLGESFFSRREVTEIIGAAAPVTASLVIGAAVMWLLIAFPIGILSALHPRSLMDRAGMVFCGILDPRVRTTTRRVRAESTSSETPSSSGTPQPAPVTSPP